MEAVYMLTFSGMAGSVAIEHSKDKDVHWLLLIPGTRLQVLWHKTKNLNNF